MENRAGFERLLAHDHWANGQVLSSLEALGEPPASLLTTFGHLLGAEACWLHRMTVGTDPPLDWESAGAAALRQVWVSDLPARWSAFLGDPKLSDPARTFTYRNWKDETWSCRVGDVLFHVLLHSAHHRGQVAAAVRAAGGEPGVTDFLHAARKGVIPGDLPES